MCNKCLTVPAGNKILKNYSIFPLRLRNIFSILPTIRWYFGREEGDGRENLKLDFLKKQREEMNENNVNKNC